MRTTGNVVPRHLVFLIWTGFAFLVLIGISASAARATHLADIAGLMEPHRAGLFGALGISEPNPARRAESVARIDAKFAAHGPATLLHVASGALLFVLVPLQFSKFIRSRYRAFHRWSGRLLIIVALITGAGGLYFGLVHPFAGHFERAIIAVVGTWFLGSTGIAYIMIRRGRTAEHREWMLRAVAGALSISMVRVVVFPLDLGLTPLGVRPEVISLHSFWIGWSVTVLAAEWWIRRTRPVRAMTVGSEGGAAGTSMVLATGLKS